MATKMAIEKHAKELMKVNPKYTKEEALDIALFDLEYTSSDAACRQYLEENTKDSDISLEEAEVMFQKKPRSRKAEPILSTEQRAYNAAAMAGIKERRVEYLVSEIAKRPELFGDVTYSVTAIEGIAPESGLPYTIKIAKHKEQKIFTKEVIRKSNAGDITPAEQRAMVIGFALANAPEGLFEALSFANSAFGFVNRDAKFGYGSIKITQHKK